MRKKITFILLELAFIIGGAYIIKLGQLHNLSVIAFCLVFTFIMYFLASHNIKPVDDGIYVTLCGFVFFASFLGSCFDFYNLIRWYDDFLHLWSGIICCQVGFAVTKHLLEPTEPLNSKKKWFVMLFVFFLTMGCASVWEILEFGADNLLGLNMQAGGLSDTCFDMLDALIGCLLTLPYVYTRVNKMHINE